MQWVAGGGWEFFCCSDATTDLYQAHFKAVEERGCFPTLVMEDGQIRGSPLGITVLRTDGVRTC